MKEIIPFILICLGNSLTIFAQVGINNDGSNPDPSAMLDIKSETKGLLPPRMNTPQRNSIPTPATGLLIFNSDCSDMQFYNGGAWIPLNNKGFLAAPGTISGNTSPCRNAAGVVYSISPVTGASTYHWTVPSGTVISSGQGTSTITVSFGSTGGVICVAAVNDCYRSNLTCLNISLSPPVTAGVSIAANANPVCAGTLVTYTATPANGGSSPQYQWKVNGTNVNGATNLTYSYQPVNGNSITCQLTSNAACVTNPTVTSNAVSMMVIATQAVSIEILASSNNVCSGTTVTFNAVISNGGTNPIYQWKVNDTIREESPSASFTYIPSNNDRVSCTLNSNILCATGNPALSNVISMIIQNSLSVNHIAGVVAPVNKTVSYGLVTNIPGEASKCWISRNLGSDRQALSVNDATEPSAGWYWQFNRKQGYKNNGSIVTPGWTITLIQENSDWLSENDPCTIELGTAWRIPTYTEWDNVNYYGGWNNWNGPWQSGLKLHAAGFLSNANGSLNYRGSYGFYWSNTAFSSIEGWNLFFLSGYSYLDYNFKSSGYNIRCLK